MTNPKREPETTTDETTLMRRMLGRNLVDIPILLVLGALVVGGAWAFFGLLEDVVMGDPIVGLDKTVFERMQALRTPFADRFLVGVTELGDARTVMPVAVVFLVALCLLRRWREAVFFLMAVVGATAFVGGIKGFIKRPRPISIYDGVVEYAFPSGHATMAIVIYGLIAILLAQGASRGFKSWLLATILGGIGLISFSRIYLGAHWMSDVLAGLTFGLAWVAALVIVYRRRPSEVLPAGLMLALVLGTFIAAGGVHIARDHARELARYTPVAPSVPQR